MRRLKKVLINMTRAQLLFRMLSAFAGLALLATPVYFITQIIDSFRFGTLGVRSMFPRLIHKHGHVGDAVLSINGTEGNDTLEFRYSEMNWPLSDFVLTSFSFRFSKPGKMNNQYFMFSMMHERGQTPSVFSNVLRPPRRTHIENLLSSFIETVFTLTGSYPTLNLVQLTEKSDVAAFDSSTVGDAALSLMAREEVFLHRESSSSFSFYDATEGQMANVHLLPSLEENRTDRMGFRAKHVLHPIKLHWFYKWRFGQVCALLRSLWRAALRFQMEGTPSLKDTEASTWADVSLLFE
jgi:hypothetical protein